MLSNFLSNTNVNAYRPELLSNFLKKASFAVHNCQGRYIYVSSEAKRLCSAINEQLITVHLPSPKKYIRKKCEKECMIWRLRWKILMFCLLNMTGLAYMNKILRKKKAVDKIFFKNHSFLHNRFRKSMDKLY